MCGKVLENKNNKEACFNQSKHKHRNLFPESLSWPGSNAEAHHHRSQGAEGRGRRGPGSKSSPTAVAFPGWAAGKVALGVCYSAASPGHLWWSISACGNMGVWSYWKEFLIKAPPTGSWKNYNLQEFLRHRWWWSYQDIFFQRHLPSPLSATWRSHDYVTMVISAGLFILWQHN